MKVLVAEKIAKDGLLILEKEPRIELDVKPGLSREELLDSIGSLLASANKKLKKLETETAKAQAIDKVDKQAIAFRDKVRTGLVDLRADIDAIEELTPSDLWPVPVYSEMLFKL